MRSMEAMITMRRTLANQVSRPGAMAKGQSGSQLCGMYSVCVLLDATIVCGDVRQLCCFNVATRETYEAVKTPSAEICWSNRGGVRIVLEGYRARSRSLTTISSDWCPRP